MARFGQDLIKILGHDRMRVMTQGTVSDPSQWPPVLLKSEKKFERDVKVYHVIVTISVFPMYIR